MSLKTDKISTSQKSTSRFFNKHKIFINPYLQGKRFSFLQLLLWAIGYYKPKLKERYIPPYFSYPNADIIFDRKQPMVTWINHATFYIQIKGIVFLTDPIWSARCSPISFIGPKRLHPPPFEIETLCSLDCVLISHNHYDHFDKTTIKALHKKFPYIYWLVPKGVRRWFTLRNIKNVFELKWWEKTELIINNQKVRVTLVPTQHGSGRGLFDRDQTLWGGFVAEIGEKETVYKRFYFAGDTGYNQKYFKAIGKKFEKIDLSLIPIGAYLPRTLFKSVHVNPKEAVQIHKDVASKLSIAMHWKTFKLGADLPTQPPYYLHLALQKEKIPLDLFRVLEPGQTINF